MTEQTRRKLNRMFDLYSFNAGLYFDSKDTFFCPLCRQDFTRDAIDAELLSVEHVIPSKLGGRIETLTCQRCNNTHGSSLDAQLVRFIKAEDMLEGLEPMPGKLSVAQAEVTSFIHLNKENDERPKWLIEGIPKQSKLGHPQLCAEELLSGTIDLTIDFNLGYKDVASRVAFIRSAYLMMFYYFGYAYVTYSLAKQLRDQIMQPDTATQVLKGIARMGKPADTNTVVVINQPQELECFTVLFTFKRKAEYHWAVSLPGFNQEADRLYERLTSTKPGFTTYTIIPYNREFVSDARWKDAPQILWRGIRHNNP